ncbi:DUF2768 domain-containing protein [Lentibacillus sediminis]|uniref:DUF2768 domain-containing protein n=1 Tax=Lentibacillus sediminis TaxID=1940529 RepID=UPI001864FB75|nr:DUF2768 domain-containing protein [Lentibacillus sediminis]
MDKMWVSFIGMGLLIVAMGLILLSRHKLKGIFAAAVSFLAYGSFLLGALIVFYTVFSGPTS